MRGTLGMSEGSHCIGFWQCVSNRCRDTSRKAVWIPLVTCPEYSRPENATRSTLASPPSLDGFSIVLEASHCLSNCYHHALEGEESHVISFARIRSKKIVASIHPVFIAIVTADPHEKLELFSRS